MSAFIIILIMLLIAFLIYRYGPKDSTGALVGRKAPDFTILDQDGHKRSLSEFRGKRVILYFYPKDNTPGCIAQACDFRDSYKNLEEQKIIVLGINYDTPETHKMFKEKQGLPFPLLSDTNKEVAKQYGAWTNIFNNLYPERKTFLIDEKGTLIKIIDNVTITNHAQSILRFFETLDMNDQGRSVS